MPIVSGDLLFKLSLKTGSAGNASAQPDVNASLGKYISTTQLSGTALGNLYDDVSGDENAASDVEYRLIFIHNNHGSLTLTSPVVWLSAETAGGAVAAISVDTTAASAIGSASAQAKEVVDENTAPATQTFTAPTTKGTGLALGNIAAGECKGIWVRRTAANTAAINDDGATIRIEGDSAA